MTEKETKKEEKMQINDKNVYFRLQKARVELQSKNIKKSGENKYSGFKYFELADFIPLVNEIFLNNGLTSNFSITDNIANLVIINIDKPEEKILFTSHIAEATLKGCTAIQAIGATHTYMKRYLYLNALEITEDDILDKEAGNLKPEKAENKVQNKVNSYSPKVVLFNKLKAKQLTNDEMNAFCLHYGIDSSSEASIQNFFRKGQIDNFIDEFKKLEAINV